MNGLELPEHLLSPGEPGSTGGLESKGHLMFEKLPMFRKARQSAKTRKSNYEAPAAEAAFSRYRMLIGAFERACKEFSKSISDSEQNIIRDQPFTDSQYFYGGRSALKVCIDALIAANAPVPRQMLDFPCGHGRALRFFRAAFPQSEIYASDLLADGVEFCRTSFGVKTFASSVDISSMEFPSGNDLIWCGSLISHMSESRTMVLVDKLFSSLSANGILLLTIHGRAYTRYLNAITPMMKSHEWDNVVRDYYRRGYGYQVYSVPEFIETQYGFSLTSPAWVYENLIHCHDDRALLFFAEKGWHEHQDVVAIQRKPLDTWYNADFL
jgi:trans-aconitate methyltransferase